MSRWYTFHIKNEILFWFFLLSLLPLLLLTSLNYFYEKNQYEKEAKAKLSMMLNHRMQMVDSYTNLVYKQINLLSKTPNVKDAMKNYEEDKSSLKYEEYFKRVIEENSFYDLFLVNPKGDIVYTVKKEADLGTNLTTGLYKDTNLGKLYRNTKELLNTQISDFDFYTPSNEDACFLATPIYGDKKLLGVIAVQLSSNKIDSIFLEQEGLGKTGEFFAAKLEGDQVISTTPLKNNKESVKQAYHFKKDPNLPIYKAVHGESGVGLSRDYVSDEIVAAWGYIPHFRWGVVLKIDLKEVLEPIEQLKFYSIIILFFVSLGIIIAILAAIKNIVEPIERLTRNVKNFSYGKLDENNSIEVDNEIGELSKNFVDMAHSLKASQNTIQKYANELEEKVEIRTKDLELAKLDIEEKNKKMGKYLSIIDEYVITSTTDPSGTITKVSKAFCDITGYDTNELIGKKHNIIRHPDMSSETYKDLWETIQSGKTWRGEIKNLKKDGSFYWVDSTVSPVFDDHNNIIAYTSVRQDITNKKLIEQISITDQLTKLYNRRKVEEVFESEINRAKRYDSMFSIILLDIDHFKSVNDIYGHDVGDMTLVDIANILKESIRKTDVVARWGGEEFIVIAIDTPLSRAIDLAQKIRKKVESHQFKVIGNKTSSFGVASFKEEDTEKTMVKRADDALYKAKENGRNCVYTIEEEV